MVTSSNWKPELQDQKIKAETRLMFPARHRGWREEGYMLLSKRSEVTSTPLFQEDQGDIKCY